MAQLNYTDAVETVKKWMLTNVSAYFPNDNTIFTYPPKLEQLTDFPAAIIRNATMTPVVSAALVATYKMEIGFVTRATDAKTASTVLTDALSAFDNAWLDRTKKMASPAGCNYFQWTQENLTTNIDPAIEDEHGIVSYLATKSILLRERVAAREF